MAQLRIAQLANFVGPTSGGMKVAIEHLGRGYVAAGAERILVIPGAHDRIEETTGGTIVHVKAPKVSSTSAPMRVRASGVSQLRCSCVGSSRSTSSMPTNR